MAIHDSDGTPEDVQAIHDDAGTVDIDTITLPEALLVAPLVWESGVVITKGVKIEGQGSGRIIARSSSSVVVGTGAKTFAATQGSKQGGLPTITNGMTLRIAATGSRGNFMVGTVTSFVAGSLIMNITSSGGSGTFTRWMASTPSSTCIQNDGSDPLFSLTEDASHSIEISGIKFIEGFGDGDSIRIIGASGQPVLIHDCWFEALPDHSIFTDVNRGIVWNCSFDSTPFSMAPLAFGSKAPGNSSAWDETSFFGAGDSDGKHNFYFEDCDFHAFLNATDFDDNSRTVFRNCLFNNAAIGTHGADTSDVGMRHFEGYDLEFVFDGYSDLSTFNLNWWFFLRGGTGVICDNIMPDITSQDYGNKAEIVMTVMNLQRNTGIATACWGMDEGGIQYPAPRQVGFGRVTGLGGIAAGHYRGDSEPLYIYGNTTADGTPWNPGIDISDYGSGEPDSCVGATDSSDDYIVENQDFFNNNTPKPGYAKFEKPHPLRTGNPAEDPSPVPHNPGSHRNKYQLLFEWSRLVGGNPKPSHNELKLLRQIYLATTP